jgi:hypothetical protein
LSIYCQIESNRLLDPLLRRPTCARPAHRTTLEGSEKTRLRSPDEILFRLRQESANLLLLARPPRLREVAPHAPLDPLPDPARVADSLRGGPFAEETARLADRIRRHQIPLLGFDAVELGAEIAWRRDFTSGRETPADYFRRIPYLDASRTGDHKAIWELNRHQHLVLLAQSFRLHGDRADLDEIVRQIESWMAANPMQRGVNWVSALEVAFRALSWLWIEHLAGHGLDARFRSRFLEALYRHGAHLERNLSIYFSPNTHLLGEAVALHALGRLLPWLPGAARWRRTGAEIVSAQMTAQVREDGSHFEQSTYYHVYALDMFAFHAVIEPPPPAFRERLARMAEYLDALLGDAGELAFLGDDDGGRFFHPFGPRSRFGRATLATCARLLDRPEWLRYSGSLAEQADWWLGPSAAAKPAAAPIAASASRRFDDSGMAVLRAASNHILFDAGPFGAGRAGHSHADTLSLVVRSGDRELLIDAGSFTYMDPEWRNRFRGGAAHSTVRIDGRDQATPLNAFAWDDKPEVRWREWAPSEARDVADAECAYADFTHRRKLLFAKPGRLLVVDEVRGPGGEHTVEQIWRLGSAEARARLLTADAAEYIDSGPLAWRSDALLARRPAPLVRVVRTGPLPMRLAAAIDLDGVATGEIRFLSDGAEWIPSDGAAPLRIRL